jgi:hypothetical protein
MAFDGSTGNVVLFGGAASGPSRESSGLNGEELDDTWTWNGTDWTDRSSAGPIARPIARRGAAMAYDKVAKRVVLFGGETLMNTGDNAPALNDTWTYNGSAGIWIQEPTGSAPPPRKWASMALDGATNTVMMFGGFTTGTEVFGGVSAQPTLNDTWVWDRVNKAWNLINPPVSPPRRGAATMAYDAVSKKVVLFGGASGPNDGTCRDGSLVPCELGTYLDDTWEWDGVARTWTQRNPAVSPPAVADAAMAYDAARQQVVLYGGNLRSGPSNQTWVWNGSTKRWKQKMPLKNPGTRPEASMAYHVASQEVVLFGGYGTPVVGLQSNETWKWNGVNWKKAI